MRYILFGQDDYSLGEALAGVKRGLGDPALLDINTTTLDGEQGTPDRLRPFCETAPFMAEKRLVIIEGLLRRYEPRGRTGRRRKDARKVAEADDCQPLADYISQIPESTVLVLVDTSSIGPDNPLLKALSPGAVVRSFPLLRGERLWGWLQKYVAREGGSISPGAVDLLAELVGSNLRVMASEINKLVLFASGRRIEEVDVNRLVSYAQETSVFAMTDAILEFNVSRAQHMLQRLLQGGAAPAYLLVMLSRQIQRLVRVKEMKVRRGSDAEIRKKLGIISDFVWREVLRSASRYSMARLKSVYEKLLETDIAIKTGKYSGDLALSMLVAELGQHSP